VLFLTDELGGEAGLDDMWEIMLVTRFDPAWIIEGRVGCVQVYGASLPRRSSNTVTLATPPRSQKCWRAATFLRSGCERTRKPFRTSFLDLDAGAPGGSRLHKGPTGKTGAL